MDVYRPEKRYMQGLKVAPQLRETDSRGHPFSTNDLQTAVPATARGGTALFSSAATDQQHASNDPATHKHYDWTM